MNQKSKKNLNASKITSLLAQAKFNPKKDGPLKGIAEMGKVDYYECRIKELVDELQLDRNPENYNRRMVSILRLTVLAMHWNEEDGTIQSEKEG